MQTSSRWQRYWRAVAEPAPGIVGEERQRARLLITLLLALMLIAPLLIGGWVIVSPNFSAAPLIGAGLYAALIGAYLLSRTRRHQRGAHLLIGALMAMVACTIPTAPGPTYERMLVLQLLLVAILLASLLLSIQATAVVCGLSIAGTLYFLSVPEAPIDTTYAYLVFEVLIGGLVIVAAALRNAQVAARRQAEAALRASEARYRWLADRNGVGIWQITPDGRTEYLNPAMCALLGIPDADALAGRAFDEFFSPASLERHRQAPALVGTATGYEVELIRADGARRNLIVYDSPLLGEDGRLQGLIGTFVDITERQRALAALHASEERFRQLATQSPDTIYIADLAARSVLFVNREEFLGYRIDEIHRSSVLLNQSDPADRERIAQSWRDLLTLESDRVAQVEYRVRNRAGAWEWVQQRGLVLSRDAAGAPAQLLIVLTLITDRKRLEEQVAQAQKMEAIGRLAGGVAHDFNNLLTVINGYAEMLLATMADDDPARPDLAEIAAAGGRAAALTRQLLTFSRQSPPEVAVVSLNALVRQAETMLRRVIGEDVTLDVRLCPEECYVRANPDQLGQVLLNLVVNARDAMPRGGRLTISTGVEAGPGGHAAVLTVADTGHGMAPDVQARIFEPFFTTRASGGGTGLGLAVVHGVVSQVGGEISVESAPGHGTQFRIALPACAPDAPAAPPVSAPQPAPGGGETLLLVEDDPAVRQLAERSLRERGYRVLAVSGGAAALSLGAAQLGRVDLVLTDVVMPGQSGPELVAALRRAVPGVRALYMSGYAPDDALRHGLAAEPWRLLAKPFSAEALARRVREALDA